MIITTSTGETPTHLIPPHSHDDLFIVRVESGQSILRPASTKHLLHGPSMVLVQGWSSTWFDLLPAPGDEHWTIRAELPVSAFRDDEHFALFCEGTPVRPLEPNV